MSETDESTVERTSPAEVWSEHRYAEGMVPRDRLEEAYENGELGRDDAIFARELAALAQMPRTRSRALFVGVLAASSARRRGSVRFDVATGGVDGLADRLRGAVPSLFAGDLDAREVAASLRNLLEGDAADVLVGEGGEYRPLVVENGHLYRHADRVEEERLADAIAGRLRPGWKRGEWADSKFEASRVEATLEQVVEEFEPTPTVEQAYAIVTAATSPLSVVTGGPGTGKTSLVVSLLRLLVGLGVDPEDVALAAPTGKAADRLGAAIDGQLGEATGQLELASTGGGIDQQIAARLDEPATLHRLLGYSQRRREFHHDAFRPLPHEYVVVDEASMVDLELMDRLVDAVADRARLVLVGDADQLPAVGSGAVFRDLVPETIQTATARRDVLTGRDPLAARESEDPTAAQAMELTVNFRMSADDPEGSNVLAVAKALGDGGERLEFSDERPVGSSPAVAVRQAFDSVEFAGAEILTGVSREWVRDWYDGPMAGAIFRGSAWREAFTFESGRAPAGVEEELDELFDAYRTHQLLSVTRRRPRGVDALDARLRRHHVRTQDLSVGDEFAVGEPVMMTKNDYERELFNGDRGVVLRVREGRTGEVQRRAVFPRREGYVSFALGPLAVHLDRAWSITVHKSQGSEYDSVGLVLPTEPIPLLTRELLYTGITRARKSVTFFGEPELVRAAAGRSDERNTGLIERVRRLQ